MYLRRLRRRISVALLQGNCRPLVARTMITALRSVSAFAVSATVAGSLRPSTAADTQELAPKSPKSETAMPVELCLPDLPPLYIWAHGVGHVLTPHPSGWPWLSVPAKDYEIGVFSPIGSARYTSRDLNGVFVLPNSPMATGLANSALRSGLDEGLIRFVVLHAESALPASFLNLLVPDLLAPSHSCSVLGLMLHRLVYSV